MELTEWARLAGEELRLGDVPDQAGVDRVLDLAKDAAHNIARPAAPVTTYLLGIAVGRGADPVDAAARLSALARRQEPEQG